MNPQISLQLCCSGEHSSFEWNKARIAFQCFSAAQGAGVQIKRKWSHPSQNTSPTSAEQEPSCSAPRGCVRQVLKVAVMSGTAVTAQSWHPWDPQRFASEAVQIKCISRSQREVQTNQNCCHSRWLVLLSAPLYNFNPSSICCFSVSQLFVPLERS